MAINLALESSTPSRAQYELDRLTLHYRSDQPWNVTVIDPSVPNKGDAHPDFRFLFVSDIQLTESGDRQCAFDVIYQGAFLETGGDTGEPVLPPRPPEDDNAVMSATSKMNSAGQILTSGVTVQFYAPTTQLTWFTYLSKGVAGTAPDPPGVTEIIKVEIGDTTFTPTAPTVSGIVSAFFQPLVIRSLKSTEVVSGSKYWKNVEKRTSTLQPWLFAGLASGDYVFLSNGGEGYTVGNSVGINFGGGTALMTVDSLGGFGSIFNFHVTSNTINVSSGLPINAFGGSGEQAAFYTVHIP